MISLSASLSSRHDLKWCHPSCCIFSICFCPLKLLQFHIFALAHTSHDLSYWQICLLANCGFEQRELRAKSLDIFAQLAKRLAACWELAKVGAKGDPDKNRVRGDSCCRRWSWWDNSPEWVRVVSMDGWMDVHFGSWALTLSRNYSLASNPSTKPRVQRFRLSDSNK